MAYSSGFRNKLVTILNRKEQTVGKYGIDSAGVEWEAVGTVWANVSWAKGNRAMNNGSLDVYGVENIVRIGSAGSYRESLNVMDVVLVNQSYSDSTYARMMNGCIDKVIMPSPDLNEIITQTAVERNVPLKLAAVHSTDVFYVDPRMESFLQLRDRTKADCVEMESFALFHNANVLGRRAACLLTISDSFCTKTEISSAERETSLTVMIELALESAIRF